MGDIVRISRLGFYHVGIYVGPTQDVRVFCPVRVLIGAGKVGNSFEACIVHNDRRGKVVLSTWDEFAGGREVHLHKAVKGGVPERLAIASRARGLVGSKFDLLHYESETRGDKAGDRERELRRKEPGPGPSE